MRRTDFVYSHNIELRIYYIFVSRPLILYHCITTYPIIRTNIYTRLSSDVVERNIISIKNSKENTRYVQKKVKQCSNIRQLKNLVI